MPRKFDIDGFVACLPTDDRAHDPAEFGMPEYAYHRDDILVAAEGVGLACCPGSIVNKAERKAGRRGWFLIPEAIGETLATVACGAGAAKAARKASPVVAAAAGRASTAQAQPDATAALALAMTDGARESLVPVAMDGYVKCNHFDTITKIVQSGLFYPVFVTGLSGNGKTTMFDQVCAKAKRELYRVNITIETDEDDLLGGFRLIDGNTVWQDGPVVAAMKNGGVLLLDEIDLASHKIMCLQPVLEGKGVYLKKINTWVRPAPGFTVMATANTKGAGDENDKFVGTNILNEAFLDRFPVCLTQDYPTKAQETKILAHVLSKHNASDDEFVGHLVKWAQVIRKSYDNGACDEIITTRRLINIAEAFSIFGDRIEAIRVATNRFPDDVREEWMNLYTKIDEGAESSDDSESSKVDVNNIDVNAVYWLSKVTYDTRIEARNRGFHWNPGDKRWELTGDQLISVVSAGRVDQEFADSFGLTKLD